MTYEQTSAVGEYVARYFQLLLRYPGARLRPVVVSLGRGGRELQYVFPVEPAHLNEEIVVAVPLERPITEAEFRANRDDFAAVFEGAPA
jgi:hypothetical protein